MGASSAWGQPPWGRDLGAHGQERDQQRTKRKRAGASRPSCRDERERSREGAVSEASPGPFLTIWGLGRNSI
jgi:hypothetical protein